MTHKFIKVVLSCAVIAGLAGCGSTAPAGDTRQSTHGACMSPPPVAKTDRPVIAVLAGIADTERSARVAARRSEAITRIVDAGFGMGARLLVDVVGGSGDGDLAVNTQLDAGGANALARTNARRCKSDGVAAAVNRLQQQSSTSPLDVLSALARLEGHLTGLTNGRVDVVLLTSMLNATGPLPLSEPRALSQDPALLVDAVEQEGLLPDCHGWHIYAIGAGQTRDGSIGNRGVQLRAFWTAFFARCGGRIVAYDSDLTQFPVSATRAQPVVAQSVGLRDRPPTRQEPRIMTITVASQVLFDNGSAELSTNAETELRRVLSLMTSGGAVGDISIRGHTDSTPTAAAGGNVGLSQRRAEAVAEWLIGHGLPADDVQAVGLGPASPVADNATPEGRRRNRRVEISYVSARQSA